MASGWRYLWMGGGVGARGFALCVCSQACVWCRWCLCVSCWCFVWWVVLGSGDPWCWVDGSCGCAGASRLVEEEFEELGLVRWGQRGCVLQVYVDAVREVCGHCGDGCSLHVCRRGGPPLGCVVGSNRLSFAGQTNAATKASTGRTGIAFHMQTKLPPSITPDCLGATVRASVHTEKTKSPGGWRGLSAHVKNEKQTAQCKGSNLQFITMVKTDNAAVPATDSLHQNFNTSYRGSNRLSFAGQTNAATKASTGRTGIAFHMQTKLATLIRANARINANAKQTSGEIQDK